MFRGAHTASSFRPSLPMSLASSFARGGNADRGGRQMAPRSRTFHLLFRSRCPSVASKKLRTRSSSGEACLHPEVKSALLGWIHTRTHGVNVELQGTDFIRSRSWRPVEFDVGEATTTASLVTAGAHPS